MISDNMCYNSLDGGKKKNLRFQLKKQNRVSSAALAAEANMSLEVNS